jgi:multidrug efflux pump subunit AcrA (membrane-fusion protein)
MKKILLALIIVVALVLAACSGGAAPTPTQAPPVVVDDFAVVAEGRLAPRDSTQIAFGAGGYVAEILVSEGLTVTAGQVIARLDNTAQKAQVAQAELELLNAQQALSDLQDNAALVTAQAQLAVVQAQDNLERAQKQLRNTQNPASEALYEAVSDAQLALETAQANAQLANVSPDVQAYNAAKLIADQARAEWQSALGQQEECHCIDQKILEALKVAYDNAYGQQLTYELRLTTDQANAQAIAGDAQEAYDDAAANLNSALAGPNATKLALAQANVSLFQAALDDAQADLAKVQSGPDPALVTLAEARIATAQAALEAATVALDNTELRATIPGALVELNLKVGQLASPGQPVATLADFSGWAVETDNLTEIEVVKLTEGQGVTAKLDALPDAPLRGQIESISQVFEDKRGDVTYTVKIALTETHPQMRWGMTAEVTFDK